MKRFFYLAAVALIALGTSVTLSAAEPFEPLFKIDKVSGTCEVKTPDSKDFVPAVEGKAYPYGTRVRTGRKSSVRIEFSKGNECRLLANAFMEITEDASDPKLKRVILDEGKLEVTLEQNIQKHNQLEVETPTAICGAVGTEFSVEVKLEQDLKISRFLVSRGVIKVEGDYFEAPELEKDDSMSIAASRDMSFIRLRNLAGGYRILIEEEEEAPREVETEAGSVLKIYQRWSPEGDKLMVTMVLVSPEGELKESISYTIAAEKLPGYFLPPRPEKPEEEPEETTTTTVKEEPEETTTTTGEDEEDGPIVTTTTSTTTTTTTTTTIAPPVTPVGRM